MAYNIIDFQPNAKLLNPHFEGYKLRLVDDQSTENTGSDSAICVLPLKSPQLVEPKKLANNALLTFDEVYSRVHYNHLFCGPVLDSFIYVDSADNVQMVYGVCNGRFLYTETIFTIPQYQSDTALSGYPGAICLSPSVVLVFDGIERIYVLQKPYAANSESNSQWTAAGFLEIGIGTVAAGASADDERRRMYYVIGACLETATNSAGIVKLHYCYKISREEERHNSTSGNSLSSSDQALQTHMDRKDITFCINAVQLDLPQPSSSPAASIPTLLTKTIHTLHSHAIPVYCEYLPQNKYILGVKNGVILDDTELVPQIDDQMENISSIAPEQQSALYYWMQSNSDVTVCIELPEKVSAQQISCILSRSALTLQFINAVNCEAKYSFNNSAFFDHIVADESVWTLENGSLLTLYLQKGHEDARWSRVFSDDDGVLETMDPNEFAEIRAQLEKHTSEQLERPAANARVHPPATRVLDQDSGGSEFDDEQNLSDGQAVIFSLRQWRTGQAEASSIGGAPDWLCSSFPLCVKAHENKESQNNADGNTSALLPPVCLKFDVDGVVFGLCAGNQKADDDLKVEAHHMGTFSALSYIQASKREKRFMYIDADMSVAVVAESQRRIYIYHQVENADASSAVQNVVDLGTDADGGSGEILGIQLCGRVLVLLRRRSLCRIDLVQCQ
ncbi:hypothetical protein BX070DRAFT_251093 [Coemansia spiralis]|nr:hypothetical protein BX070DRAFT_251093 [Coemansia spiralis]